MSSRPAIPDSSPEDAEAVQLIAREIEGPTICALSRAIPVDIEACGKALARARRPRIHTGIGASDIHIGGKFRDERYGKNLGEKKITILRMAVDAVKLARQYADDVEFYAEDAGRADPAYLMEMLQAVIDAGATVVNIPDTTGYAVPEQYGCLIRTIREQVPNIERATISVHCHDDLGLAVANSLSGILNGARQVEGTINGIGERAGNAALEEVVMALRTRADYFKVHTDLDAREFHRTSRLVADTLGIKVPPEQGRRRRQRVFPQFGHSRGWLPQGSRDLRDPAARRCRNLRKPGRADGAHRASRASRPPARNSATRFRTHELNQAYDRFLAVADKKQEVFDEDLVAILHDEIHPLPETLPARLPAHLQRHLGDSHGYRQASPEGRSARRAPPSETAPSMLSARPSRRSPRPPPNSERYEIRAVTSGTEAMGEVTMQVENDGRKVLGRGASTDVIEASAKAYIDALNKLANLAGKAVG